MAVLVCLVPSFVIALVLFCMAKVIARARRTHRAWSGLTAEARCLRTYTTTSGGGGSAVSTTLHHVFEFTAHDGRPIRFKADGAPATILEGDLATVWYAPDDPEGATAEPPAPGGLVARTGCGLLFLGACFAVAVIVMVQIGSQV